MKLIQRLFILIFIGLLIACGGSGDSNPIPNPTPSPEPTIVFAQPVLENVIVNQFSFQDTTKLAATNKGIYTLENNQWTLISNSDWYVYDIAILLRTHFIASIKLNDKFYLVESLNSGERWEFLATDFGGPDRELYNGNERINRIKYDPSNGVLYATGFEVLASSNNLGRNWTALSGNWQGLARGLEALSINFEQNTVWFGGQGAIEDPIFRQYSMITNAVTVHDDITHLLPLPSTIKGIVLHPTEANTVFAMGEGGIIVSRNSGNDWSGFLLDDNYRFYYNLIIDHNDASQMYTAGWSKDINDPQKLVVERTRDGGATWEIFNHPSNTLNGGVQSMAHSLDANNELVLHFGLYKGGIIDVRFNE